MRLVETKTYRIDMASAEVTKIDKIADDLEQIALLFIGKEVFYTSCDDCDYRMTSDEIMNVVEFLRAITDENVEVN